MNQDQMNRLNGITQQIIGAAIAVHKEFGPGLLESVYEVCLMQEMENNGLKVASQVELPLWYKGKLTDKKFRIELPIHEAQLLTYMRLTNKHLGLLINFNVPLLKDGIIRRII